MQSLRSVYLKDICNVEKGATGLAKVIPGEYLLVATGAERRTCESFQFDTKAVCIPLVSSTGHGHASLKNVHYQEGKFALGTILVALTAVDDGELDIQFLHLYLSQLKDIILVPLMSGAANVALSVTKIKNIEISLPAIEKQKEIVVQFKSIVIEEAELKNELTHQQTLLKKLRQQVLQEAIEGKLTEEFRIKNREQLRIWNDELRTASDPETIRHLKLKNRNCSESAASLLSRIKAEKEQLIKDKKIKKQKALPPITDKEKPFDLPDGWVWCRLEEVGLFERGKSKHRPRNDECLFIDGKYPFVQTGDVARSKKHGFRVNTYSKLYNEFGLSQSRLWNAGTLCITIAANIAETGFLNIEACFPDSVVGFTSLVDYETSFYVKYFIDATRDEIEKFAPATAQKNINLGIINMLSFPLPSLLEQKEIIAKVERLFAICDRLETQGTQNQTHAEQLMQAVLKEAFQQNSALEGKKGTLPLNG